MAPADPAEALDAHHFAERFGLFLIILLGEVVVEAGQASVDGHVATAAGGRRSVAAMVLAGALWWLYFDSAAELNRKVLELSGGSPTMARAIFAVGHMLPAFALLLIAAGVGLLLEEDPPRIAYWLACIGIGIYLAGTRVFLWPRAGSRHRARAAAARDVPARPAGTRLGAHGYVWLLTAWVTMCAGLSTRTSQRDEDAAVERYLGGRRAPER